MTYEYDNSGRYDYESEDEQYDNSTVSMAVARWSFNGLMQFFAGLLSSLLFLQ